MSKVTVEDGHGNVLSQHDLPDPEPTVDDARALLATFDAEDRLTAIAERVSPEQAVTLAVLLPPWTTGETVEAGALRTHDGLPYEAIQGHTTQADWTPAATPALWRRWRAPDAAPEPWVQPTGGHDAYGLGDRVTHEGQTWESTVAANVWKPGEFGWTPVT